MISRRSVTDWRLAILEALVQIYFPERRVIRWIEQVFAENEFLVGSIIVNLG